MNFLEVYFHSNLANEIKKSILQDDTARARLVKTTMGSETLTKIGNVVMVGYTAVEQQYLVLLHAPRLIPIIDSYGMMIDNNMIALETFNPNYWRDVGFALGTLTPVIKFDSVPIRFTEYQQVQLARNIKRRNIEVVTTWLQVGDSIYYFHSQIGYFPSFSGFLRMRYAFTAKDAALPFNNFVL